MASLLDELEALAPLPVTEKRKRKSVPYVKRGQNTGPARVAAVAANLARGKATRAEIYNRFAELGGGPRGDRRNAAVFDRIAEERGTTAAAIMEQLAKARKERGE